MQISDEGLRLIKSFEGYYKKRPDGSCEGYKPIIKKKKSGEIVYDIPTIGYGCTEGVTVGMVWTHDQAIAALKKEIAKHEKHVTRLCTVDLNQNEFDALTSFSYNCGSGNLAKLIVPLNKGDRAATARKFSEFVKAQGIEMAGLVSRRARETAIFLKPVEEPEEPHMPQTVEQQKAITKTMVATGATAVTAVVAPAAAPSVVEVAAQVAPALPVPAVPEVVTQSISNVQLWKGMGEQLWTLKAFAVAQPILAGGLSICIAGFYLWSKKRAAQ
jgi:lysozyme